MADSQEKIVFTTEDGEKVDFYVLEQTTINGVNYLLVADSDCDEEANALILEETSDNKEDIIYNVVDNPAQLQALSKVFAELLDDVDFEMDEMIETEKK
jgi:Protein of unknown function (DUF1292).